MSAGHDRWRSCRSYKPAAVGAADEALGRGSDGSVEGVVESGGDDPDMDFSRWDGGDLVDLHCQPE